MNNKPSLPTLKARKASLQFKLKRESLGRQLLPQVVEIVDYI